MSISVRLTEQDEQLFRSYAKTNNISLSELFRNAVFEKIEDEYDLQLIKDFESREEKGEVTLIEFDDLKKEFDL